MILNTGGGQAGGGLDGRSAERVGGPMSCFPRGFLPRRHDRIKLIGQALVGYATGTGYRHLAAQAGLPPSTVRNWLRAFAAHVDSLAALGAARYYRLDTNPAGIAATRTPAGTPSKPSRVPPEQPAWG